MKLTIVVPCYNEAENIPFLLERFNSIIGRKNIEVLLINNGSTDNTEEVISRLLPDYPFARMVLVPVNHGYGYGIVQGLKQAEGDYIGWTHADLQTDPGDVVKAYKIINKRGNEQLFIKGNRKGRSLFDEIFTRGMGVVESLYFKTVLLDINAQPNVFPKNFFESWENPPFDFSIDLFALYMAKIRGLKVVRFAVNFPERLHGESKWNNEGIKSKWKLIKRTLKFSGELKHQVLISQREKLGKR